MHRLTLAGISRALQAREFSSEELVRHLLGRIERLDGELNAFITVTAESALAAARAADAARSRGEAGPLAGVPIAQKDIFCTAGVKTSCGSRMLDNFVSPYDATVVEKLNAAGVVMLGKTNMDEFAMGSSNETSFYGPVRNPWDPRARARRVLWRLGSRGGGPAGAGGDRHGHRRLDPPAGGAHRHHRASSRPTARVPLRHDRLRLQPRPGRRADPAPRTRRCCSARCRASIRATPRRSTRRCRTTPRPSATRSRACASAGPGVLRRRAGSRSAAARIERGARGLREAGREAGRAHQLPNLGLSVPTYYVVAPAECSSNLSRFDGVRFGYRCAEPATSRTCTSAAARRRFRRRGQAPHHDRHLRALGRLLRRLLPEGAAGARADRRDFGAPSRGRRDRRARPRRRRRSSSAPSRRPGHDVSQRHLHHRREPRGPARHVDRPAASSMALPVGLQLIGPHFRRGADAERRAPLPAETDWHLRVPAPA
jgi:Asp-tRNA(Asn)/Glu-tRNA(Gln) amidotransferase A subunit family amidase